MRHLDSGSTRRRHLPYLPTASAIRREIDPMAVSRPTWHNVLGRLACMVTRHAAERIDNKNVCIARSSGVESNVLSVGRPTWSASQRVEVGQLSEVTSIAPAHPDLIGTAAGGFEGNLTSIGRELRT